MERERECRLGNRCQDCVFWTLGWGVGRGIGRSWEVDSFFWDLIGPGGVVGVTDGGILPLVFVFLWFPDR